MNISLNNPLVGLLISRFMPEGGIAGILPVVMGTKTASPMITKLAQVIEMAMTDPLTAEAVMSQVYEFLIGQGMDPGAIKKSLITGAALLGLDVDQAKEGWDAQVVHQLAARIVAGPEHPPVKTEECPCCGQQMEVDHD